MAARSTDLAAWSNSKNVESAIESIGDLPKYTRGRVLVPFPFVDRRAVKKDFTNEQINAAIEAAPTRKVPVAKLVSGQHSVNPDRVAAYVKDPDAVPKGEKNPESGVPVDKPIVLKYKGQLHLWDGNHRATAAHLRGEKTISARVADLDEKKK